MKILLRIGVAAVALWVATVIFDDIAVNATGADKLVTLIVVALIFGLVNALIKPLLQFMAKASCLFYLTLGLISLVINAALLLLTAFVAGEFDVPFDIEGSGFDRFVTA
ncbi:MAG: phage holin family protein, partial [Stackebrandtia sp.]